MSATLTVHFIRHGEVHNPEKILYGRLPDYRLSDVGRGQASGAARHLADHALAAIYVSPMQRAQETAQIIATAQTTFLELQTDERLNEVHSPHDGASHEEMDKIRFDLYTDSPEGYEQPRDLRRRLLNFLAEMREKHAGEEIAAVTHGDIVVAILMYAKEQEENEIGRTRHSPDNQGLVKLGLPEPYPATASISTIRFYTDHADEVPEYHYLKPY